MAGVKPPAFDWLPDMPPRRCIVVSRIHIEDSSLLVILVGIAAFRRNTRSIYFFCKAAVLHVVWLLSTAVSQHAQCGVALPQAIT